ncbi:hypothetical protein D5S17_13955 [Pseudonocardiaceae bacterium YIM PH 21723]|nr:hypothetical protein D5S17_13955 [Pseudonocardiaceae bacterium YIM PH 21723]
MNSSSPPLIATQPAICASAGEPACSPTSSVFCSTMIDTSMRSVSSRRWAKDSAYSNSSMILPRRGSSVR